MASETLLLLSWIILFLPLVSFVFLVFFGKKIGKPSAYIGTAILGIDLILAAIVCYSKLVTYADVQIIQMKFSWFSLGNFSINAGIGIDNLAALMLMVVTVISFLVHMFSIEYMSGDKRYTRYFSYLGIFSFSMLGIVIANNLLFMYIFWELVGLSSYLLIGFWYEKDSAANAGKKAFITNRVGDFGFLIGILIMYLTFGSFMFDDIFGGIASNIMPFDSGTYLTIAGILLFCGAIGKSAQFPLHVWLPDAMEGPTPVSALIHAATMVAAGVYLVARIFPMLTADALTFIAYVGAFTAFFAATIALTQNDFKKVLAYSTVSQLGYMVMSIGVCAWSTGFFHLMTHAWFKGALFLASGSVIHAMHISMHHANDHHTDPQDIRNMGGLRKTMPLTYLTFLMVTLAISGVPFTSGFLSKDGILAGTLAFAQLTGGINWLIPMMGFGAAGMTAFYMLRLTIIAFHGDNKTEIASHTKENKFVIVFPLIVLSILSFWIIYSPNPFNANAGWYAKAMPAPRSAVPAEYQFKFLTPYDESNNPYLKAEGGQKSEVGSQKSEDISQSSPNAHHGAHHGANKFEEQMHATHIPAMILSLIIAGLGIFVSFLIYQFKIFNADNIAKQMGKLYNGSLNKWYLDEIYQATAINGTVGIAKVSALFDNKIIDGIVNLTALLTRGFGYFIGHFDNIVIDGFVNLVANVTAVFGAMFRKVQTGRVQSYVVMVLLGIIILVYYFI
ncbi:MAG: NADH-quinone oxidoreductase subunit L [bacterium]